MKGKKQILWLKLLQMLRIEDSTSYGEMGILVRTNGLCQHLEDALLANNIPYTVSGGTSFFPTTGNQRHYSISASH